MSWSNNQIPRRPCKTGSTENPDEIIFYFGTNDLPFGKGNKDIAEAIINLAMSVKTQSRGVLISGITMRKDKHHNKVQEIESYVKQIISALLTIVKV